MLHRSYEDGLRYRRGELAEEGRADRRRAGRRRAARGESRGAELAEEARGSWDGGQTAQRPGTDRRLRGRQRRRDRSGDADGVGARTERQPGRRPGWSVVHTGQGRNGGPDGGQGRS